jgi:predicted transcriptional regulator
MVHRKKSLVLGELEILIMKEIWRQGRATVHTVRDALKSRRNLAYTTILTTLRNLERKGFLHHENKGRTFVFMPRIDKDTVARLTLREILDRFFDGSAAHLVNALFEEEDLSMEEFEKLRLKIIELRSKEGHENG